MRQAVEDASLQNRGLRDQVDTQREMIQNLTCANSILNDETKDHHCAIAEMKGSNDNLCEENEELRRDVREQREAIDNLMREKASFHHVNEKLDKQTNEMQHALNIASSENFRYHEEEFTREQRIADLRIHEKELEVRLEERTESYNKLEREKVSLRGELSDITGNLISKHCAQNPDCDGSQSSASSASWIHVPTNEASPQVVTLAAGFKERKKTRRSLKNS